MSTMGTRIIIQNRAAHHMDVMTRSLHLGQVRPTLPTNPILTWMNLHIYEPNGSLQDILSSKERYRKKI